MFSLNRAQIVGNLTRDPEMRYTPNGQAVCSFGVATNRRWKDQSGNLQEATEFHNIVAWRRMAEIASQYLHKGSKIYVEGRIQTRTWEGQDGQKRNKTEIVAENFIMLTPKGTTAEPPAPALDKDVEEFPASDESTAGKPASASSDAKALEDKESTADKPKKSPAKKEDAKEKTDEETGDDDINLDEIPF